MVLVLLLLLYYVDKMPPQSTPSPPDNGPNDRRSSSNPTPSLLDDAEEAIDFDQTLKEVEQSLLLLKARYAQIQLDRQHQHDLQQRKEQIEKQLQHPSSQINPLELKRELKRIRQQLEELEVALESQLFSWSGLKEIFWQAVRFGGLGIVIGWILKSLVG